VTKTESMPRIKMSSTITLALIRDVWYRMRSMVKPMDIIKRTERNQLNGTSNLL